MIITHQLHMLSVVAGSKSCDRRLRKLNEEGAAHSGAPDGRRKNHLRYYAWALTWVCVLRTANAVPLIDTFGELQLIQSHSKSDHMYTAVASINLELQGEMLWVRGHLQNTVTQTSFLF